MLTKTSISLPKSGSHSLTKLARSFSSKFKAKSQQTNRINEICFLSTISNIHIVNTNKLTPKERQQSGIAIFLHVQPLHDKKISLQSCTCDNSHFFSNSMSNLFFKPSIVAISSFSRSCRLFYTTQSSYLVVSLERIDFVNKLISQPSTNQNKRKNQTN